MEISQPNQWIGRVLDDRYRLISQSIGGRGWDEYNARDLVSDDRISIKILSRSISGDVEFFKRLTSDIATANAISHPHVETVYGWGQSDGIVYLVTDNFPATNLQTLLDQGHLLTAAQATQLGFEVASGLAVVHRAGLCHGGISPSNLLIGADGSSKLAGFFLANAFNAAEAGRLSVVGTGLTEPSSVYAAPEMVTGSGGYAADVYSLAATLVAAVGQDTGDHKKAQSVKPNDQPGTDLQISAEFGSAVEILTEAGRYEPDMRCDSIALSQGLIEATKGFTKPKKIAIPQALLDAIDSEPVVPDGDLPYSKGPLRPRWRPVWKVGATVGLVFALLSVGAAWAVSSVQPQGSPAHLVQDYIGRTVGEVRAIADSRSWVLDEDQARTDDLPVGIVLAQRPSPGRHLREGEMLVVEVVSGPRLRMTPLVLGLPAAAAVARFETKGFEVDLVQPLYDEKITVGEVMKVLINGKPALGGALRDPGTRAVLVVSGGPVPRTVPQLTGMNLRDAEKALEELQLTVARPVEREPSETIGEGIILSQGLTPGLLIDRGSEVTLTVSSGPDRREVPDMRGLTVIDAQRRLAEVGLQVGEIRGDGSQVQGTEPAAGTLLRPGSTVLLWAPAQD